MLTESRPTVSASSGVASSEAIQAVLSTERSNKWRTLLLLSLAELLGMAVWFSASAVVPALTTSSASPNSFWKLDDSGRAWLTMSVQGGFVVGAFGSALLNLADRVPAARLFTISALLAALATALIPALAGSASHSGLDLGPPFAVPDRPAARGRLPGRHENHGYLDEGRPGSGHWHAGGRTHHWLRSTSPHKRARRLKRMENGALRGGYSGVAALRSSGG
jgi:hypothetical protein